MKFPSMADSIDKTIVNTYAGLLTPEAQDFISRLKTLSEAVSKCSEDENMLIEFNAARNTLTVLRGQFTTASNMRNHERIGELCQRMNEDVAEFTILSRLQVL